RCRSRATCPSSGPSSRPTSTRAAVRSRASRRWRPSSLRSTSTRGIRRSRSPRDRPRHPHDRRPGGAGAEGHGPGRDRARGWDKGGKCPLQDLTFRYGPGSTRMTFSKRTFDKPIPISPLIALDRERCILCYRCTRFSESVSEDGQLVAVNRGAQSMIATFGDEPYRGPFTGNVTELCPVGALTSTQYRFEARSWEIQHVPSVCGLCPVGCNVDITIREGKVKRVQSRNHHEVDAGWLCDKGRYAF